MLHISRLEIESLYDFLHEVRRRKGLHLVLHAVEAAQTHHVGRSDTEVTHCCVLVTLVDDHLGAADICVRSAVQVESRDEHACCYRHYIPPLVVPYHAPQVDELDRRLVLLEECVVGCVVVFYHDLICFLDCHFSLLCSPFPSVISSERSESRNLFI